MLSKYASRLAKEAAKQGTKRKLPPVEQQKRQAKEPSQKFTWQNLHEIPDKPHSKTALDRVLNSQQKGSLSL